MPPPDTKEARPPGEGVAGLSTNQQAGGRADVAIVPHGRADVLELDDLRPEQLAGWRRARAHLLDCGLWPIVPPHIERALKRRRWW